MNDIQQNKINNQEIKARLKKLFSLWSKNRKKNGLKDTQRDFLQAIKPGQVLDDTSIVSQWLSDKNESIPSLDNLVGIANLFGSSLDWLVFGKGEPPAILSNTKEDISPYTLRDICKMLSLLVFACDSDIQVNTQEDNKSIIFSIRERKFYEFFSAVSCLNVQMLAAKQNAAQAKEFIETGKMITRLCHTQNIDYSSSEDIYKKELKNISDIENKLSALHVCDPNDIEPLNALFINIFSHLSTLKELDENEIENYYKQRDHVVFSIPGYSLTFSDKPLSNNVQNALNAFFESVPDMTMENYLRNCLGLSE